MSLTHFSSTSSNLPETLWWSPQTQHHPHTQFLMDSNFDHHKPPQSSTFNFNIHHHQQQESDQDSTTSTTTDQFPKEPMFEKPLTPSDVGKLNRLVIPKQHAEKYFPLSGGDSVGAEQQKGFLLTFEDESGKLWRFRYSYWNSSQSYVLTKGWSRYVKEKRLESGDVVLFERHRFDSDRLFIGWRRRANVPVQDRVNAHHPAQPQPANGWTTARVFYDAQFNYPSHHLPISLHQPYQLDCLHATGSRNNDNVENNQRDMMGAASGNPRSVRLFGVNLECPDDSEPSTPDGSSHGAGQPHYQYNSNNKPDEVPPTSRIRSEECDMYWISQFCQQTPLGENCYPTVQMHEQ